MEIAFVCFPTLPFVWNIFVSFGEMIWKLPVWFLEQKHAEMSVPFGSVHPHLISSASEEGAPDSTGPHDWKVLGDDNETQATSH